MAREHETLGCLRENALRHSAEVIAEAMIGDDDGGRCKMKMWIQR